MKASISSTGVLTITPESSTEAYALTTWEREQRLSMRIDYLDEASVLRGSGLKLDYQTDYKQALAITNQ